MLEIKNRLLKVASTCLTVNEVSHPAPEFTVREFMWMNEGTHETHIPEVQVNKTRKSM